MSARPYHHGSLRTALLVEARRAIEEVGPTGWSLRDLARRAGVSHAAPAHHFGDKRGLLTAIAVEGYDLLAEALEAAWRETASFLEVGVAYVRFAVDHRAHFEVMYRADLLRADDPALVAVRDRSARPLFGPLRDLEALDPAFDATHAATAAWALVHGFASLWLNGNLRAWVGDDPERAARAVARYLFTPMPRAATPPA